MGVSDDGEVLHIEIDEGIAVLTLSRPHEGNAITVALQKALEDAWAKVVADDDIRVAIVTGAGEKHFCTGASIKSLNTGEGGVSRNLTNDLANRFSPRQCRVWKPVICAVNGLVNGGGLHFVTDCDIIVASETAVFMDSHVSVGQVGALENIGVARRATMGAALLMTLVGRSYRMSAARAHQIGLVDLLEPTPAAALATAWDLARKMLENSPQAMALSKRAIWGITEMSSEKAIDYGWELVKSHWSHPDYEEGPKAFLEKRSANWNPDPDARR
jgi:enoyl-CoA hydratase/carnithine racemase